MRFSNVKFDQCTLRAKDFKYKLLQKKLELLGSSGGVYGTDVGLHGSTDQLFSGSMVRTPAMSDIR